MSTLHVSVRKTSPDSKVGIGFSSPMGGRIFVSSVNPNGLCANTDLVVGQELISINGIDAKGKTVDDMKTVIGRAQSDVVFAVSRGVALILTVHVKGSLINYTRDRPPHVLDGIPVEKWHAIYDAVTKNLLHVLAKADSKDLVFKREMSNFVRSQMVKGFVGFGTESGHEKKVFGMLYSVTSASSNANLVASNILAMANALLNPHGILAQLVVEERASKVAQSIPECITLLPIGLVFSKLHDPEVSSPQMATL